ncbi:hypothetical protein DPEC_G00328920 [Dallia pectoralis]|uniref:Uncharacterized protein n=1 Tax=Dallia pectoralis TaxID=75939 RepID=A0ACC2F8I4_DALPE|nr:hypothetical protein DPEC_G00328920 [Dallia pectoralis]
MLLVRGHPKTRILTGSRDWVGVDLRTGGVHSSGCHTFLLSDNETICGATSDWTGAECTSSSRSLFGVVSFPKAVCPELPARDLVWQTRSLSLSIWLPDAFCRLDLHSLVYG